MVMWAAWQVLRFAQDDGKNKLTATARTGNGKRRSPLREDDKLYS